MSDKLHTQHLSRNFSRFIRTLGKLHTAAFATPTGMNLRFDNYYGCAKLFGRVISLFRRSCHGAARHGHTKSPQ
jgi:hypothetical protein